MHVKFKYLLILIIIAGYSCKNKFQSPMEKPLAAVGDKYLYKSDLSSILPNNLTYSDSLKKANDYRINWIRKELMLKRAEENLSSEQKDVQSELEDYRASLIIHRYQQELVKQRLDTVITDKNIQEYYEKNSERFILQKNIIKGIYIEVPKEVDSPEKIKKWLSADETESTTELETYSFQYAVKFDYFIEKWMDFSLIESRIPLSINNKKQFIEQNRFVEASDSLNSFYLSIKEFMLIGEKAPYNFVKDQIENLILNNRKLELIKELEKNVLEQGKEKNLYKIND